MRYALTRHGLRSAGHRLVRGYRVSLPDRRERGFVSLWKLWILGIVLAVLGHARFYKLRKSFRDSELFCVGFELAALAEIRVQACLISERRDALAAARPAVSVSIGRRPFGLIDRQNLGQCDIVKDGDARLIDQGKIEQAAQGIGEHA